ncbi:MAG: ExbD/TolR family protein [Flavobacteriales bacterium]|jgi:biopolymer transport protein ExbD
MDLKRKNKIHAEASMSALSDIIFMLLIFFVIASTLAVNGEQVDLPSTSTGTPSQATTTVTINEMLEYSIDNIPTSKETVESMLQQVMAGKGDDKVILNIDRSVPTGETIELFSILKSHGWKPFIATKPAE